MPLITTRPYDSQYGLLLNGTDQYGFNDVDLANTLALSVWFRPTTSITTSTAAAYLLQTEKVDPVPSPTTVEGIVTGGFTGFVANETITIHKVTGPTGRYRTSVQSFTFSAGTWYNIIINWIGSRYDVIIDNSIQSVTAGTSDGHATQLTTSTVTVGTSRFTDATPPSNFSDGAYANLILFDTALLAGEITTIYNGGPNGPTNISGNETAIYKFNDRTGTTAADSSGNGNDLTLVNNPTWLT